ncbi:MAG: hypothetical protein ACTSX8_07300 [Alphaproteobacteria bacterium]
MNRKELVKNWGKSPSIVARIIAAQSLDEFPATVRDIAENHARQLYHVSIDYVRALTLNSYLETHGLEAATFETVDGDYMTVEYLNTGDSYALTLCRTGSSWSEYAEPAYGSWHVASWGYYVETFDRASA